MSNVYIIENFIDLSSAAKLEYHLDKLTSASDQPHILSALGLNRSEANKVSRECPILPLSDNEEHNEISMLLTELVLDIKDVISQKYRQKLELKNCVYNNMLEGSSIGLHADTAHIENGEWVEEEAAPFEYSGLFYFNDDYTGGELNFPTLNKIIKPAKNTLVFFHGNSKLPHEVLEVKSGIRKNLVLFFGSESANGEYIHDFRNS